MRVRLPSPATAIAVLALIVALTGTAYAANVVPLAKRALVADNAKKLKQKTPAQIAAMPGPATSLNGQTADDRVRRRTEGDRGRIRGARRGRNGVLVRHETQRRRRGVEDPSRELRRRRRIREGLCDLREVARRHAAAP
jgi:hypothetical protein